MSERQAALRIAVDGASGAGKTTTARALGERLGQAVVTPEEAADGRTVLFDWMDYAGGRHRGQPIQTQVIAVPGHRYELRRAILELADVVLFVADSSPSGIYDSAEAFRDLQAIRAELDPAPSIVVQANKRDAADAHGIDELRALLEVDDDVAVVETVASTGDGVRQAFVFAVRSGLSRLDAVDGDRAPLTIDELEQRLLTLGGDTHAAAATPTAEPAGVVAAADVSPASDADADPVTPDVVPAPDAVAEPEPPAADPGRSTTVDAPVETIEIEIPAEDTANLETLRELLEPAAAVELDEPVLVPAAPVPVEAAAPAAADAASYAHLPPPPTADGASGAGRTSRWRRRKAAAPGAGR